MNRHFKQVPIEYLQRGSYQPRRYFSESALQELAQSISAQGIIEPLVVRPLSHQHYEIIAGERRWRAAMIAGLQEVPCIIGDYNEQQTAAITLIENIQREDLNILEEAGAYQQLIQTFQYTQDDLSEIVGKSRSHIANLLRLLTLCEPVQAFILQQQLTLGHARMLVGLHPQQQLSWAQQVIKQGWSVRQLEQKIRQEKQTVASSFPTHSSSDSNYLQTCLAEQLGAPVQITTFPDQSGQIIIKFYNNDTLEGLLARLGLRYD